VANERFALEKHFALTALCAHLGARSVKVEQVEIRTSKGVDIINVKADVPGGFEAQARYNKQLAADLEGRFNLEDQFVGGPPDLEAARNLLQAKRLTGDPSLWSLYEARAANNKLLSRSLSMSLKDVNTLIERVTARLKVPTYVGAGATSESSLSSGVEYRLYYRVEFPAPSEPTTCQLVSPAADVQRPENQGSPAS
jgi:hypothetical protein